RLASAGWRSRRQREVSSNGASGLFAFRLKLTHYQRSRSVQAYVNTRGAKLKKALLRACIELVRKFSDGVDQPVNDHGLSVDDLVHRRFADVAASEHVQRPVLASRRTSQNVVNL